MRSALAVIGAADSVSTIIRNAIRQPFAIVSGGIACILGMLLIVRKWPALLTYNGDEPIVAGATAD